MSKTSLSDNLPAVSVVTVCKNAEEQIERTMTSVANQDYKKIEYIVIDGKSTDKTIRVIDKYKKIIDVLVSEKDKGIYDAMNKGIKKATGDIIYFLNAGDTLFCNTVVSNVVDVFQKYNSDIVYGDISLINANGKTNLKRFHGCGKNFLMYDTICHQAIFTKKRVFDRFGEFDDNYRICADYDWLLRSLFLNKLKKQYVNITIANFYLGGISNNTKYLSLYRSERSSALSKYFSEPEIIFRKSTYKLIDFLSSK